MLHSLPCLSSQDTQTLWVSFSMPHLLLLIWKRTMQPEVASSFLAASRTAGFLLLKQRTCAAGLSIWCSLTLECHAAVDFEDSRLSSSLKIAPAVPLASETSEDPMERANLSPSELTYILPNSFWPDRDPRHQSQKEEKVG